MASIEHPLTLTGRLVVLEPLAEAHFEPLLEIAMAAPEHYRFTSTPTTPVEAERYFGQAFRERDAGTAYPFAVRHRASGELVGSSRLYKLDYGNRSCEVGFTWFAPAVHGSGVNLESKYLMLRYVFDSLDFLRVQFHTDARNLRSQKAILKLGAVYEGTLRAERVMKDGFIRDSMLFSIIHTDWPDVKRNLEARLGVTAEV